MLYDYVSVFADFWMIIVVIYCAAVYEYCKP